jgi:phenylpropionate dioxygenase-like ring-hydroxylating dioxygenase large terminal subunit
MSRPDSFFDTARRFWHPVARGIDIAPGAVASVRLLGQQLALWRDADGRLGLVEDCCIHRGTMLSAGTVRADGCIRCPYHGWSYDRGGTCVEIPQSPGRPIPPTAQVDAYPVEERAGLIWVCLVSGSEPRLPCPEFPGMARDGWRTIAGAPLDWSCTASRNVENFLDMAHFGWIHDGTFGNPDVTAVDPYTVEASDDDAELAAVWSYPSRILLDPSVPAEVVMTEFAYRVVMPFTVWLESRGLAFENGLLHAVAPLTETTCRTFWMVTVPDDTELPDEIVEQGQLAVYEEDRGVVETQRPPHVPLDPTAELHLPFDRFAVAYRRALRALGFS